MDKKFLYISGGFVSGLTIASSVFYFYRKRTNKNKSGGDDDDIPGCEMCYEQVKANDRPVKSRMRWIRSIVTATAAPKDGSYENSSTKAENPA